MPGIGSKSKRVSRRYYMVSRACIGGKALPFLSMIDFKEPSEGTSVTVDNRTSPDSFVFTSKLKLI